MEPFRAGLAKFLLDEGLDHRIIPRYEHASNGLIENVNQRVTEIAAVLLFASGLSLPFWSYSVVYAALIYNLLPNSSLNWKSPFEVFSGEKFNTDKIVLFGSKILVHIPKEIRSDGKFSQKAEVGIFLGFNTVNDAFIVYLPESDTFTESLGYFLIRLGYHLAETRNFRDAICLMLFDAIDGRSISSRIHASFNRNGGWWKDVCNDWPNRPVDPFKAFFRMNRQSFSRLLTLLEPHIRKEHVVREPISPDKRLAMTLLWYSQGASFADIGEKFGVGYNTVSAIVKDVSKTICEKLVPEVIIRILDQQHL
jgi:hypothetical protein